ncbi:Zinc finger protein 114 [Dissostichus eleginoides]|uniref:Zinc finger protein 114 n=1 Tax=Dissostichus eleginoides TaxID=100907 RepID=A0AAD9CM38_DISEL|nr:Zinc finger protein 114 [Dissostichus eleginoides]
MSATLLLRLRVSERLEAAVEEIFGLVEKTVSECQEEAVRSKREILQLRKQIEQLTVLKPTVVLYCADAQPVLALPVLEEMEIQEQLEQKEAYECFSPDTEADSSNNGTEKKSTDRSIRCPTCGRTFYTDADLKVHVQVHESWKLHITEKQQGQNLEEKS